MNNAKERIKWIDVARSFAILSVVLCHATEHIYKIDLEYIQSISFKSRLFAINAFVAGRLGVPIFMMISGYLLFSRVYSEEDCRIFWKNNLLQVCAEIWTIIYSLFLWVISVEKFSYKHVLEELFFVRRVNMGHVWYLPMIIGMYILIPYVANALNSMDIHLLKVPFLIYLIASMGFTVYNVVVNSLCLEPVSQRLSLGFSGGAYGLYFTWGYCIYKGWLKRVNSIILIVVSIGCFILTSGFMLWAYSQRYMYNVWYDCLPLFLCTACGFELFSRIKTISYYKVWRCLARYSFSIYLIHNMIMYIIKPVIQSFLIAKPIKVFFMWVISFLISLLLSALIRHIPKVGAYILYLK